MTEIEFSQQIASLLNDSGYLVKTEIDSGYGIADVVALRSLSQRVAKREKYNQFDQLSNENFFKVLEVISENNNKPTHLDDITNNVNLSNGYIRSKILKGLESKGFIKNIDNKLYLKINGWAPLSNNIIAIESKLSDWKRGIIQALRYKTFANKVYLALPENKIHLVDPKELERLSIGLVTIKRNKLCWVYKCKSDRKDIISSKQNYVCEFFWNEMLQTVTA